MKEQEAKSRDSETGGREEFQSFAEAKKSYAKMLAKLLAIEILIEEGIIDEDGLALLEQ